MSCLVTARSRLGALADHDLVEGPILDELGLVHDVSAVISQFVSSCEKDRTPGRTAQVHRQMA